MLNKPHWQILLALILATGTALLFRELAGRLPEDSTGAVFITDAVETCRALGKLFMNALKMIIVPLIVSSVISGIASLHGVAGFGRLF